MGTDPNFEEHRVEDARISRIDYVSDMTSYYIVAGGEAGVACRITNRPKALFA